MNTYFKAIPALQPLSPAVDPHNNMVLDNDKGTIYETPFFFNIYCLRKWVYKDGSCMWHICLELKDGSKYMVVDTVKGSKEDAQKRCMDLMLGLAEPSGE
jgi:hypothetical protein